MHIDIHCAHFNARVEKSIFVEIPPDDTNAGEPKQCGTSINAMHGTRHAAVVWHTEVQKAMNDIGMETGVCSPCAFRRRGGATLVHVDDFLVSGRRKLVEDIKKGLGKRWDRARRRREGAAHPQPGGVLERERAALPVEAGRRRKTRPGGNPSPIAGTTGASAAGEPLVG